MAKTSVYKCDICNEFLIGEDTVYVHMDDCVPTYDSEQDGYICNNIDPYNPIPNFEHLYWLGEIDPFFVREF